MGLFSAVAVGSQIIGAGQSWYNSQKSADAQEDIAKERAENMKYYAEKEYKLNSKELTRAYTNNIMLSYMQQADEVFTLSRKRQQAESEIGMATLGKGTYSSSARGDLLNSLNNEYNNTVWETLEANDWNIMELTHEYNHQQQQLLLNRDKMKADIISSVELANANATATRREGYATSINQLGQAFAYYDRWYLGGGN